MRSPSLVALLLVETWFLGGCTTPFREKGDWPLPPSAQLLVPAEAGRGSSTPVLSRFELQRRLTHAGVHFSLMSDESYVLINHASLPALLDWYGAMIAVYGHHPAGLQQAGFRRDRTVRLLRISVSTALMRHDAPTVAAPAIGMVRITLLQPWAGFVSGQTGDFLVVATERGLFVVDPVSRAIRPLARDRSFWRFDGARF